MEHFIIGMCRWVLYSCKLFNLLKYYRNILELEIPRVYMAELKEILSSSISPDGFNVIV